MINDEKNELIYGIRRGLNDLYALEGDGKIRKQIMRLLDGLYGLYYKGPND